MGKVHSAALALVPFFLAAAAGCGSDSGSGGGGCQNLQGTYHGTSTCSDGTSDSSDSTGSQTGCNATLTSKGQATTGTVSGNRFTSPDVTCTVSITGDSYTSDCSYKGSTGATVTCHGSGTVTDRPVVQSGAGGGGNIGAGGGSIGAAGGSIGAAGGGNVGGSTTTSGPCGPEWSSTSTTCNDCMNGACCTQLRACGPGTACDAFLRCAETHCASGADPACVTNSCANELQAASGAVSALSDCNTASCQACN